MIAYAPIFSALFACTEPVVETPSHLTVGELSEATTLRPLFNNENGNLLVEIVDDNGFAVSGETVTFTVDGATSDIQTDAYGVAKLELEGNVNFGSASWNEQSVNVQGVRRNSLPKISGYEAWHIPSELTAFESVEASDGALYAYGSELWWVSERRGAFAQHTGTLDGNILGMDSGHIDGDGILDAVAYTATTAYVLRGRPYGGFTVLTKFGLEDENHTMIGAMINHLNEDLHGDLALASSSDSETKVTVMDGDGSWGFDARAPLLQGYPATSVVVGDENNDQLADVTLIDEDGVLRRFSYSIEGWIGGFPSVIDPASFISLPGAELGKPADINGDGNNDTIIFDGEGASTQDLVFFTIGETITKYSQSYKPYYGAVYDVDESGSMDIFSLSSEFLHLTYLDSEDGTFAVRNLNTIPMVGPLQLRDFDKDGLVDFNVLGQHPARVYGSLGESEKWTPRPVRWREDNGITMVDNLWAIGNVDANDEIEVGAIIDINGEKRLRVWRYGNDFTALSEVSDISLGNSVVSDLKVCNGDFFLINDNGTSKRLRQIQLDNNTLITKRRTDVEQDFVECTLIDGLNHFLVWGGVDSYTVYQQSFVSIDAGTATGWRDGDIGATNNGQTHVVRGCSGANCQVEYADINRDGNDELMLLNSDGITITGLGAEDMVMDLQGTLSTMDIDGNQAEDLIVTQEDGWVWVFHATGFNWSAVQGVWMSEPSVGEAVLMDVDQDGTLETIRPSSTGTLLTSDTRIGG